MSIELQVHEIRRIEVSPINFFTTSHSFVTRRVSAIDDKGVQVTLCMFADNTDLLRMPGDAVPEPAPLKQSSEELMSDAVEDALSETMRNAG